MSAIGFSLPTALVAAIVVSIALISSSIATKLLAVVIGISATFLMAVFSFDFFKDAQPSSVAIIVGAFLASLGWVTTNTISRANLRKSHTMDVVIKTRIGGEILWHRRNVFRELAYNELLTGEKYVAMLKALDCKSEWSTEKNTSPPVDSLRIILNHYEYIAASVRGGELDYSIIKNTLSQTIISYHDDWLAAVILEQKRNPASFEHLAWLVQRLRKDSSRKSISKCLRQW